MIHKFVRIIYDETKRQGNLAKHGLDFALLDLEFFAASAVLPVKDSRYMAVGLFHGQAVAVIFRPLGREAVSIISMRRASRKERSVL